MGTSASFMNPYTTTAPVASTGGGLGAGGDLPTPAQLAPHVMGASQTLPLSQPTLQQTAATIPLTHTHTNVLADPLPPIPRPEQIAPHVFFNSPASNALRGLNGSNGANQSNGMNGQNALNGQNGLNGRPGQPPISQLAQPRALQQPPMYYPPYPQASPPVQQRMPQPMPMQQPQMPPQQPQAAQPPQNVQEKKSSSLDDDLESAFGNKIRDDMNKRFNAATQDPDTREGIVMELERILEQHPKLAEHPDYKPFVDAFMVKFLKDPNSGVKSMALLNMEMGLIQHPSEPLVTQLQKIAAEEDHEMVGNNKRAINVLGGLQSGTLGQDLIDARNKKDKDKNKKDFQSPDGTPSPGNASPDAMTKGAGQTPEATPAPEDPSQQAAPPPAAPATQANPAFNPAMANPAAWSNPMTANPLAATAGNQNWAQALQQAQPNGYQPQTPQQATQYSPAVPPGNQYPSYYGMNGRVATGYPANLPTAYAQPGQNAYFPNSMAGGVAPAQRRLDLNSLSPSSYIPSWFQTPNTGQRLNMVEGVGA